jgi:hypothetical protein
MAGWRDYDADSNEINMDCKTLCVYDQDCISRVLQKLCGIQLYNISSLSPFPATIPLLKPSP